jgi:hypothetical protein
MAGQDDDTDDDPFAKQPPGGKSFEIEVRTTPKHVVPRVEPREPVVVEKREQKREP